MLSPTRVVWFEKNICENIDPWTAGLRFYVRAGLLTGVIAAPLFPVAQ